MTTETSMREVSSPGPSYESVVVTQILPLTKFYEQALAKSGVIILGPDE
ncbi:MAG: hypothetical protein GX620_17240 [Chloroflexi bacterium]|nr:hypothetical protein [Chloroflexota bacterium]